MRTALGDISYIPDTAYFDDLVRWHDGARVLIAAITRPRDMGIPYHLSTDDAVEMLKSMEKKPEVLVMSHIGMKMHFANPPTRRQSTSRT